MRYYAPLMAVKRTLADGRIGTPLAFQVERRDLLIRTKPWLQQRARVGGMLYQSTCHEFDLMRWLGGEIVEISSHAARQRIAAEPLEYSDLVVSQVRFAAGAVGQIWSCMTDPRCSTAGWSRATKARSGSISTTPRWAGAASTATKGRSAGRRATSGRRSRGSARAGSVPARPKRSAALLADFRDACLGIAAPPIRLADGIAATELAQAGYRSIAEGTPVRLPLLGEERARLHLPRAAGRGAEARESA